MKSQPLISLLCLVALLLTAPDARAHSRPWEVTALMKIEPSRVTYSIYTSFGLIDAHLRLDHRDPDVLHQAEVDTLEQRIVERFGELVSVKINGEVVPARIDRIEIARDLSQPGADPEAPTFDADTADVTIVVTHPTIDPPRTVGVTWSLVPTAYFDADEIRLIQRAQPTALMANVSMTSMGNFRRHIVVGPGPGTFSVDNSDVEAPRPIDLSVTTHEAVIEPRGATWSALVTLACLVGGGLATLGLRTRGQATLGLGCVLLLAPVVASAALTRHVERATPPDDEEARSVARQLIRNVYLAGMYTRDEDVYDLLASSVDGDYLRDLYHELYAVARRAESPDGATTQVLEIDVLSCEVARDQPDETRAAAFRADLRWRVRGLVHHFNHVHTRANEYAAAFTVAPVDGSWKLTSGQPLRQVRVDDGDPLSGARE